MCKGPEAGGAVAQGLKEPVWPGQVGGGGCERAGGSACAESQVTGRSSDLSLPAFGNYRSFILPETLSACWQAQEILPT